MMQIDTYEQLSDLPVDAVIRDSDGEIGRKRSPIPLSADAEWQVMGDDRDPYGYLELVYPPYFRLPVDLLWPPELLKG